jgi:hypothetical protein
MATSRKIDAWTDLMQHPISDQVSDEGSGIAADCCDCGGMPHGKARESRTITHFAAMKVLDIWHSGCTLNGPGCGSQRDMQAKHNVWPEALSLRDRPDIEQCELHLWVTAKRFIAAHHTNLKSAAKAH